MAVYEKAPTVGGTTAVSGGIVWIPAHDRLAGADLNVEDALKYLEAQSLGLMDRSLVETFVRTGPVMLDFLEAHSELRFEVAEGFPRLQTRVARRTARRRTVTQRHTVRPVPDRRLGGDRITAFPVDFSNVGIDAETRARIHAAATTWTVTTAWPAPR